MANIEVIIALLFIILCVWALTDWKAAGVVLLVVLSVAGIFMKVHASTPVITLVDTIELSAVDGNYFHYTGRDNSTLKLYVANDGAVTEKTATRYKFVTGSETPKCEIYNYQYKWLCFKENQKWFYIYVE